MQNNEKYIKKSVEEIFHLSTLLMDFCKHNSDMAELGCLYTGLKVLHKKADELNIKVMGIE